MDELLTALRAAAEPTRLRLLALAARGSFCVTDFTEILGQSQPRLSRHLKLLGEAGLLDRVREGANVWFVLPDSPLGRLARNLLAHAPETDPLLAADRRQAARVLAERARAASEAFQRHGAHWDEMHALGLDAEAVENQLLRLLPQQGLGRVLDIGTGTARLLEVLAPRISAGIGIDASRAMLVLARARLAQHEVAHCSVRQADMYRLPFADQSFDMVVMQMVLHHAEDPHAALTEAARVLHPGGTLLVVDLLPHDSTAQTEQLAHRWPGFSETAMRRLLQSAEMHLEQSAIVSGPLDLCIWCGKTPVHSPIPSFVPGLS